jgi:hypothetical protein
MSDEKGKKAGGISKFKQQYGQIGGGTPSKRLDSEESERQDSEPSKSLAIQPSEHQSIEASKQPDSQQSNYLSVQPSESPDRGESSMSNSTTVEHLSAQKSRSKQQRDKLTVYLEPELNDWIRQQVIIEKRKRGHHVEISDIINEALHKVKDSQ